MTLPLDDALVTGTFNIADMAEQQRVRDLADSLLATGATIAELDQRARVPDTSIDVALALKLASSRRHVIALDEPIAVTVVFAMWGESRRLRPRAGVHPNRQQPFHIKQHQHRMQIPEGVGNM